MEKAKLCILFGLALFFQTNEVCSGRRSRRKRERGAIQRVVTPNRNGDTGSERADNQERQSPLLFCLVRNIGVACSVSGLTIAAGRAYNRGLNPEKYANSEFDLSAALATAGLVLVGAANYFENTLYPEDPIDRR